MTLAKIYLTQGGTSILLPVPPAEIKISSKQKVNVHDTALYGQITHIGRRELLAYEWESFFPGQEIAWALNPGMLGMEYVNAVEAMRDKRQPIRLVIPHLAISADTAIEDFTYSQAKGKDIHYSLSLLEYRSGI